MSAQSAGEPPPDPPQPAVIDFTAFAFMLGLLLLGILLMVAMARH